MITGTTVRASTCKHCQSDDIFTEVQWEKINGMELKVKVTHCNYCTDEERYVFYVPALGQEIEIYHDIKQEDVWHAITEQPSLSEIKGTTKAMAEVGYTKEQSKLIGNIDYMFEEAVRLNLCTGDEAINIGHSTGMIFGKHTGKLR